MNCGTEILVRDVYGNNITRYVAQCGDRFLLISYKGDYRNGSMMLDWRAVLRDLVATTVPAGIIERQHDVQSAAGKTYVAFPLTYPLPVAELARLLDVPADEVRTQLANFAVRAEL